MLTEISAMMQTWICHPQENITEYIKHIYTWIYASTEIVSIKLTLNVPNNIIFA